MVVFLGADGSGKSSVIERITADLVPTFCHTQYMHLRPGIGIKRHAGPPVTDPHAQPVRGWTGSAFREGPPAGRIRPRVKKGAWCPPGDLPSRFGYSVTELQS